MKAAIFYGPRDIRIEEIEKPRAGENGIVIRVRAAGICGSDLHPYNGALVERQPCKIAMGHENAGDVVEVGANVEGVDVGDRVWAMAILPCYDCDWCKQGNYKSNPLKCRNSRVQSRGLHGSFAEYLSVPLVVLPQKGKVVLPTVIKLPETMSYQEGALIEPISVGYNAVRYTEPNPDDVAVVLGAGIIGLGAVVSLKARNVRRIIVTDVSQKRLQVAKELGADLVLNPTEEDVVKRVRREAGNGVDIVLEAAGKPATFLQATDMVRLFGKVMMVGVYEEPVMFDPNLLVLKGVWLKGWIEPSFYGGFEIMEAGWIKDKQVVSHTFSLDRINEAFETSMNAHESVMVMVEP